ncbi:MULTISPECIES: flagellar assembly protein FliW [Sediminibacillus]|uniref:flagellar assembly protein FliW n=1 Tax=Sediminibacillus TaxID=482460 RepID=UPI0003F4CED5|nr:flagellar assembly protein FliW [Sediminibacillus terrae]
MKIKTKYLGEVEIDREKVIAFPHGIPGFIEEKEFVLLDLPDNPVFQILQSINTQQLAFIVTAPYQFNSSYEVELDKAILDVLEINEEQEVVILAIISLKEPFEKSTINLQAPLVINNRNCMGKQFITNNKRYGTKEPINVESISSSEKGD